MNVSLNRYILLMKENLCEIMAYNMELDRALDSGSNVAVSSDIVQSLAKTRSLNFAYIADLRWFNSTDTIVSSLPDGFQQALSQCHRRALLDLALAANIGQDKALAALMDQMAESLAFDPLEPLRFNLPDQPDITVTLADIESNRRVGMRKQVMDKIVIRTFLLPYYAASMIWIRPSEAVYETSGIR